MPKPNPANESKYDSLVVAVATGQSIASWCRKTGTSRTTVSGWQREPEFERDVSKLRRELIDQAIGRFTAAIDQIATGMVELAAKAVSEPTRLAAMRAVFEQLIAASDWAETNRRLGELERRFNEQQQQESA